MADFTRRDVLTRGAAGAAWLATLGIPERVWALQDGEEPVTLTDYTAEFKVDANAANPTVRCYDLRTLTTWATPNTEHYTFHQTTTQQVNPATYRLRIDGFVERPREFRLDQLKARRDRRDEGITLECSGNSTRPQRMSGLLSNGVWTGVGLASILKECGLKPEARELVFLGLDMETERKAQAGNRDYVAPHGRSVYIQDALNHEAMLAFSLNGRPLSAEQGFPLRLILPGWYGMTQIKWLGRTGRDRACGRPDRRRRMGTGSARTTARQVRVAALVVPSKGSVAWIAHPRLASVRCKRESAANAR